MTPLPETTKTIRSMEMTVTTFSSETVAMIGCVVELEPIL